jgi:hypothetical protein
MNYTSTECWDFRPDRGDVYTLSIQNSATFAGDSNTLNDYQLGTGPRVLAVIVLDFEMLMVTPRA